jgi:tight adherence protein B
MTASWCALAVIVIAHRLRPRPGRAAPDTGRSPHRERRFARSATKAIATARRRHGERIGLAPAIVAEWCSDLARSVRSGDALRSVLMHTVPANEQLRTSTDPLRLGLNRGRTIVDLTEPGPRAAGKNEGGRADHLGLAYAVVAVCGQMGGSAAAPLDRVAASLRQRAADDHERAAQAAQAQLSAHVLTLVPVAVLVLLVLADPEVRGALASLVGATCVAIGVTLNVMGWFWMRRVVRGADR